MTDLTQNYITVNIVCAVSLLVLAYASWTHVLFVEKMRKQFAFATLITIIVILSELVTVVFSSMKFENRTVALIANTIGFSLSPFIAIILSDSFAVEQGSVRFFLAIPVWINGLLTIISPWTGWIFSVSSESGYARGPLFFMYVVAYLCSYIILTLGTIKALRYYQCHTRSAFFMILLLTMVGTTIQLVLPHVQVTWLCITLGLLLFYGYFCVFIGAQDALTGLLNRSAYDEHVKRLENEGKGIVIVFDMDCFKQINDTYGHQWGDTCLSMAGKIIKDSFCKLSLCYRIGGDEFCVISENTNEAAIKDTITRFHLRMDDVRKNQCVDGEIPMISTGYALFHKNETDYDEAVKVADAQMYIFKNKRKKNL